MPRTRKNNGNPPRKPVATTVTTTPKTISVVPTPPEALVTTESASDTNTPLTETGHDEVRTPNEQSDDSTDSRVNELEAQVAGLQAELRNANAELFDVTAALMGKIREVEDLTAANADLNTRIEANNATTPSGAPLYVSESLLPVLRATLNEAAFGHVTPEHTQQLFALVAQIDEMG